MKRRDFYRHMDRNHTAINGNYHQQHRAAANVVTPDFLLGPLWIQEPESNGVKIMELDSNSSNNDGNDSEDKQTLSHAWSYVNNEIFRGPKSPPNDYEVNHKARENHRQNTRYKQGISSPDNDEIIDNCIRDYFYSNYQDKNNEKSNENYKSHHKNNCFTNTNEDPKTSDSSTDVEYIDGKDLKAEVAWNAAKDRYYDEILTCDSDTEADKRTIYIYSFKNRHLFAENEGINISNCSSTSTDVGEEQTKDQSNGRVASPIPDIYVPKINFIKPTKLPTVTEITEPKSSEEKLKTKYEAKAPNGWFEICRRYRETEIDRDSSNLISWMSLSPREKRRRGTFCENCRRQAKLPIVKAASPIPEEDLSSMKYNVEEHTPVLGDRSKIAYMSPESSNEIQYLPDWEEDNHGEDRGDHLHNKSYQKLKIKINSKTGDRTMITEPIEKLESNNWIGEETIVQRKSSHQLPRTDETYNASSREGDVSRRLWENNMVLLKPAEWSQFYPAESVPSLHLSLETEIEEVTWFRRIIRCLKCFK